MVHAQPPSPGTIRDRAREILDDGYQRELPVDGPTDEVGADPAGGASGTRAPATPGAVGTLARLLLYGLLGAVVLAVLVGLGREAWRRARAGEGPAPDGVAEALGTGEAPPGLDEVEALAREARFDEAVHLLLRRVLTWLIRREGRPLPASLTTREVLATTRLAGEQRGAFEALVLAVEHSLFGRRPVGAAEWERCLAAYRRLEASLGRAA